MVWCNANTGSYVLDLAVSFLRGKQPAGSRIPIEPHLFESVPSSAIQCSISVSPTRPKFNPVKAKMNDLLRSGESEWSRQSGHLPLRAVSHVKNLLIGSEPALLLQAPLWKWTSGKKKIKKRNLCAIVPSRGAPIQCSCQFTREDETTQREKAGNFMSNS